MGSKEQKRIYFIFVRQLDFILVCASFVRFHDRFVNVQIHKSNISPKNVENSFLPNNCDDLWKILKISLFDEILWENGRSYF